MRGLSVPKNTMYHVMWHVTLVLPPLKTKLFFSQVIHLMWLNAILIARTELTSGPIALIWESLGVTLTDVHYQLIFSGETTTATIICTLESFVLRMSFVVTLQCTLSGESFLAIIVTADETPSLWMVTHVSDQLCWIVEYSLTLWPIAEVLVDHIVSLCTGVHIIASYVK